MIQKTLFTQANLCKEDDPGKFWVYLKSGRFASMIKEASTGEEIRNSLEAYNIVKPLFIQEDDVEQLWVIFLNAKNRIISIQKMFSGSITSASVYSRELVKEIIRCKAAAVVMIHNHPSLDPEPSAEDFRLTVKIAAALYSIDVTLHEHLVIGGDRYHSMADSGFIQKATNSVKRQFEILELDKL